MTDHTRPSTPPDPPAPPRWTGRRPAASLRPARFLIFIGYPRSGHSLLGALLNAHPEVLISHELDVLERLEREGDDGIDRGRLFRLIVARDHWFDRRGRTWAGYDYGFTPLGSKDASRVRVIGDKKGGVTSGRLGLNPDLLDILQETVGLPLRIIHHIRNPFDNIATLARKGPHPHGTSVADAALFYRQLLAVNTAVGARYPDDVLVTHHDELLADPAATIARYFHFIGIEPDPESVRSLAANVDQNPSRSRNSVEWPADVRDGVREMIASNPLLARYIADDEPEAS